MLLYANLLEMQNIFVVKSYIYDESRFSRGKRINFTGQQENFKWRNALRSFVPIAQGIPATSAYLNGKLDNANDLSS